jgi:hypothetical protein
MIFSLMIFGEGDITNICNTLISETANVSIQLMIETDVYSTVTVMVGSSGSSTSDRKYLFKSFISIKLSKIM